MDFDIHGFDNPKVHLEQYPVDIREYSTLYEFMKKEVTGKDVVEWCSGTGLFILPLSPYFDSCLCYDIDNDALKILKDNITRNNIQNCTVRLMDVTKFEGKINTLILNPPFGVQSNILTDIEQKILEISPDEIYLLLPIDTNLNFSLMASDYLVKSYIPVFIKVPKIYDFHIKESVTVPCSFIHYIRKSSSDKEIEQDEEYLDALSQYIKEDDEVKEDKLEVFSKTKSPPVTFLCKFFMKLLNVDIIEDTKLIKFVCTDREQYNLLEVGEQIWLQDYVIDIDVEVFDKLDRLEFVNRILSESEEIANFNLYPNSLIRLCCATMLVISLPLMTIKDKEGKNKDKRKIESLLIDYLKKSNVTMDTIEIVTDFSFETNLKKSVRAMCGPKLNEIRNLLSSLNTIEKLSVDINEVRNLPNYEDYIRIIKEIKQNNESLDLEMNEITEELEKVTEQLEDIYNRYTNKEVDRRTFKTQRRKTIENFMKFVRLIKIASDTGAVRDSSTLESLIHYAILLDSAVGLTGGEKLTVEICRDRLINLRSSGDPELLSVIIKSSVESLYKLVEKCHDDDRQNLESLILRYKQSVDFSEAWHYAIRLKGYLYESLFAYSHGLMYTPEALKFSISDILYLHCNEKYSSFLQASSKQPGVRDMKPDFYIIVDDKLEPAWKRWTSDWNKADANSKYSGPVDILHTLESSNYTASGSLRPGKSTNQFITSILKTCGKKQRSKFAISINDKMVTDNLSLESSSTKISLNEAKDKIVSNRNFLIIIEVGYQTSLEKKVFTDYRKWKSLQEICRSIGLDVYVFCLSDSTETLGDSPWLSRDVRQLLKNTIGQIFHRLTISSPIGIQETAIADISTQEYRSALKSGHVVKTPISVGDTISYYERNTRLLFERPGGAEIPREVRAMFENSMIRGSTITKTAYAEGMQCIKESLDMIGKNVEMGKMCVRPVSHNFVGHFFIGMYETAIESISNQTNCPEIKELKNIFENPGETLTISSIYPMLSLLSSRGHRSHGCEWKGCRLASNWFVRLCNQLKHEYIVPIETTIAPDKNNPIDILCSSPLSGRSGRSKDVKYKMLAMLGDISNIIGGLLRDSKGLVLCSYNSVLSKLSRIREQDNKLDVSDRFRIRDLNEKDAAYDKLKKENEMIRKLEHSVEVLLKKKDTLLKSVVDALVRLCKDIKNINTYRELEELFKGKYFCRSIIWGREILESYEYLSDSIMNKDPIIGIMENDQKKREKFENKLDDRYPTSNPDIIKQYVEEVSDMANFIGFDEQPEIVLSEVKEEIKRRYSGSIYEGIDEYLYNLLSLILSVSGARKLYLYSKVCDTYNNFTSEMSMSGYKVGKIRGSKCNLLCKVNSNKNTNSGCVILDSDMSVCSSHFMLDRERAILGQSAFYCLVMTCLQVTQMQRCARFLMKSREEISSLWSDRIRKDKIYLRSIISDLGNCRINNVKNNLLKGNSSLYEGKIGIPEEYLGIYILCRHLLTMLMLWIPCIMRNSRKNSKLFQMIRYPTMACMGKYAYLRGIGTKLDGPARNVDTFIMRNYILIVGSININNRDTIVSYARRDRSENCNKILSYTIAGCNCLSERQMLFDIYICHFYNKEDTNYAEGSIRVLEEMGEKHVEWEEALNKACKSPKNDYQMCRLLMGVKYCTGLDKDDENSESQNRERKRLERRKHIRKKKEFDLNNSITSEEGRIKDSSSDESTRSSTVSKTSIWTLSYQEKTSDISKRIMRPRKHGLSTKLLKSDLDMVSKNLLTYTFGVPEIVQIAAEHVSAVYSDIVIGRALKSSRNNEPITKISETTSILSKPNFRFDLKSAILTVQNAQATKVSKLINRLRRVNFTDGSSNKKFEKELMKILSEPLVSKEKFKEEMNSLANRYKSQKAHWSTVFNRSFQEVFCSDNMNFIFTFVKSYWKEVRKYVNTFNIQFHTSTDKFDKNVLEEYKKKTDLIKDYVWKGIEEKIQKNNMFDEFFDDFTELIVNLADYEEKIKEFPTTAFPEEEEVLVGQENNLFNKHSTTICQLCLSSIMLSQFNLVNMLHRGGNLLLIKLNRLLGDNESERTKSGEEDVFSTPNVVQNLMYPSLDFMQLYSQKRDRFVLFGDKIRNKLRKFIQLLVLGVDRPIATGLIGLEKTQHSITELSKQVKKLMVSGSEDTVNIDFHITIADLIKSSLITGRKILGKRDRGLHLPRGVRSKVIYEMYRSAKELGTSNIQEMAFKLITEVDHDFFGALAPKAQIGGDRDLLVNETKTKICIHVTESCSKSLLESAVDNDGLINKKLKETILSKSINMMEQANSRHGNVAKVEEYIEFRIFHRVICILGDCKKWGPIHCTTFFSLMIQQIMKNFPDWVEYYKLVMLKSILKMIEIPVASLEKVMRSFINDPIVKEEMKKLDNDEDLSEIFIDFIKRNWKDNKVVRRIYDWYVLNGKAFFQPWNHMGQGIHHATSSLFANILSFMIDELIRKKAMEEFPDLVVSIEHASSSDDFSKIISLMGVVNTNRFDEIEKEFDRKMCKIINVMTGLMRCCQMLVSEKTIYSDISAEFYSEFAVVDRISPSPAKFILNQIINSSVTSPLTLYQSVHVTCQQAMYMGLPFLTIFALSIFKQLIFINSSVDIYKRHSRNFINSLPIFGRLYLPKYSIMTSSNAGIEDLMTVKESLNGVIMRCFGERGNLIEDTRTSDNEFSSIVDVETVSDVTSVSGGEYSERDITPEQDYTSDEEKVTSSLTANLLTCLALRYYNQNNSPIFNEEFNSLQKVDYQTMFSDCFIQLVPESVRQESSKLREFKKVEVTKKERVFNLESISNELINVGCLTENYTSEISRLDQALHSKNVVWGLSGGIKNTSISIHRQVLRAYLFDNKPLIPDLPHWIDDKLSIYIDDKNQKVPYNRRVKYTDFLSSITNAKLELIPMTGDFDYNVMVEPEDGPVSVVIKEEGGWVLKVEHDKLISANKIIENMINELGGGTFNVIYNLEKSKVQGFEAAPNIVTKKSSIWVSDKTVSMINSPNVVVAYYLCKQSLFYSKPTNVNFARIDSDINSLSTNYPQLFKIISEVKKEVGKDTLDGRKHMKCLSLLTNVCRLLQTSRNHKVSLYMFKNLRDSSEENNPKNLMTYSIVEGCQMIFKDNKAIQFHNELVYSIRGCISLISWSSLSENEKTELLMRFLKVNVKSFVNSLIDCDCQKYIKSDIKMVPDGQILSVLYAESDRTRDTKVATGLRHLVQTVFGSERMAGSEANLTSKPVLEIEGDLQSGNFTFSCEFGSATGLMQAGRVFLTLSSPDKRLFESVEGYFLRSQRYGIKEQSDGNLHNIFLRLLPSQAEDGKAPVSANIHYIVPEGRGEISIRKPHEVSDKTNKRYVFVSHGSLVTRYSSHQMNSVRLRIKWLRNRIIIGYDIEAMEVQIPPSIARVNYSLKQLKREDVSRNIEKYTTRKVRFEKLGELSLYNSVPLSSYSFFHILIKHPKILIGLPDTGASDYHIKLEKTMSTEKISEDTDKITEDELLFSIMETFSSLDDIFCINLILHHLGFVSLNLRFDGIEGDTISDKGKWSIGLTNEENVKNMSNVLKSISLLCNNFIRKETVQVTIKCNIEKNYIETFKTFNEYIKLMGVYSSTLEFFVYMSSRWVCGYIANCICERDSDHLFLPYLLSKVPVSFQTTSMDDYRIFLAMNGAIENLYIEYRIDGFLTHGEAEDRLLDKLSEDMPTLLDTIGDNNISLESAGLDFMDGATYVKLPVPMHYIAKSSGCFKMLLSLFKLCTNKLSHVENYIKLTCFLIISLCGKKVDLSLLSKRDCQEVINMLRSILYLRKQHSIKPSHVAAKLPNLSEKIRQRLREKRNIAEVGKKATIEDVISDIDSD